MFKNVATKIAVFALDTATNLPKTGDAGNITVYVSKDYGTVTALADTSATEMDSTNAKGWYLFDVAQAETNADALLFTGKSSTSGITILGGGLMFTTPASFTSFVTPTGAAVNATQFGGQTVSAAGTVTMPGTVASATNITAGTITTVTNLTNAPSAGDFTSTMKTSIGTAVAASAVASVTGAVGSVTGAVGSVTGNVGGNVTGSVGSVVGAVASVTGNVGGNVTGSVGSVVGAVGSVTGFTAADVATIKAKTNSLTFTVAGQVDANVQYVNDTQVTGDGHSGTEWGPA